MTYILHVWCSFRCPLTANAINFPEQTHAETATRRDLASADVIGSQSVAPRKLSALAPRDPA